VPLKKHANAAHADPRALRNPQRRRSSHLGCTHHRFHSLHEGILFFLSLTLQPTNQHTTQLGSIGGSLTYNLATLFAKLSLLSLFLRFSKGRILRGVIYLLMLIALGYTVANAFIWAYLCTPMQASWDFTVKGASCMGPWPPFVSNGALNAGSDILILMVAVWVVWG
jgi:hypothetical protein